MIDAAEQAVVGERIGTLLAELNPDLLQALAAQRSRASDLTDWITRCVEIEAMELNDPNRAALESVVVRTERLTYGTAGRSHTKGDDSMAIENVELIGPSGD